MEGAFALQLREFLENVEYSYVQSANLTNPSIMENISENETLVSGRSYWVYVDYDYTITIDTDMFLVTTEKGIVPKSRVAQDSLLDSGSNSTESALDVSPGLQSGVENRQHQEGLNYGAPFLLIIAAMGIVVTGSWSRKRRK